MNLKEEIRKGIPSKIPSMPNFLPGVSRAPKLKKILNTSEKKLAVRNALLPSLLPRYRLDCWDWLETPAGCVRSLPQALRLGQRHSL